jgi:tripartite-type tricarboxylate transporter receptor subunit TctC
MPRKALFILASLFAVTISASQSVVAGGWPHRTVKIIAPLPAGGATDLAARLFAEGFLSGGDNPRSSKSRPALTVSRASPAS